MLLMLGSAVLEVVSLGAVLPFIAVLVDPAAALDYPLVGRVASAIGVEQPDDLILPLTIGFGLLAALAGAFRLLILYISTRLSVSAAADLSMEAYRRTLYQPYQIHVERNSSEVLSGVLVKVEAVNAAVFGPIQTLGSSLLVAAAVIGTLLAIDPIAAVAAFIGLGASYGLVMYFTRRRLRRNSEVINVHRTRLFRCLQEGLGGIRDVLLGGVQAEYMRTYRFADLPLRRARSTNAFIGVGPRFVMESLALILIALLAYGFSRGEGGVAGALPILGALAVGGQRLLPALQQGFAAWAAVTGSEALIRDATELLEQPMDESLIGDPPPPLGLESEVRFRDVSFRYHPDGPWILHGVNLTIPKGSKVAIVGPTGSGKSTLLDLLMGLLEPTSGMIEVDRRPLTPEMIRSWQRTLAHVPQHIFLTDSSLAENIALGTPTDRVDLDRVDEAVRRSCLAEFVDSSPLGLAVQVGEQGIKLSGGQRQRIGIARALHRNADILVLDEATSALDNLTELQVTEEIRRGTPDITMVVVAHRLSTVEDCDLIVELIDGRVAQTGTYLELLESSPTFRRLANVLEPELDETADEKTEC
tara:strand:- start:6100 stop:7860 length:1761 start_codon:yes stop_codon:yes gene_type:complete